MKKFRKACRSFLSLLLALITLVPAQLVRAADNTDISSLNSGTHWGEDLPTSGDELYTTDTGWHRLVLEYGSWCTTNSMDSEGRFVNTNDGLAGTNYRDQPASLYRYDEYSEDGMYSLYVKYAGKAWNGEACYYIAPCSDRGDREKKLWALTCEWDTRSDITEVSGKTINQAYNKYSGEAVEPDLYGLTVKPLNQGILPEFRLVTVSVDAYKNQTDLECKKAVTYVPVYDKLTGETAKVTAEYKDSHKWIISKNTDGSWSIRSAGTIGDWDWADKNGALNTADLWIEETLSTEDILREALAHYARLLAYQTIPSSELSLDKLPSEVREWVTCYYGTFYYVIAGLTKEMKSKDEQYKLREGTWPQYMMRAACDEGSFLSEYGRYETWGSAAAALPFIGMIFLAEYAKNVYITGSYQRTDIYMKGNNDKNIFTGSSGAVDKKDNRLYVSYGMKISSSMTYWAVQDLFAAVHNDWGKKEGETIAKSAYWWKPTSCSWAVYFEITTTGSGGAKTAKTNQQIRDSLPYKFEGNWVPSDGDGAFWGLYVGTSVETDQIAAHETNYKINKGESAVLGGADSDDDGVCESIGLIGTMVMEQYRNTGSKDAIGPTVTIEEGGLLQIDGPTFAAVGTTLVVHGTLIISPGASLSTEMYSESLKPTYGLSLLIKGGSVIISSGAVVDLGNGTVSVSDGGELINNGVFVHRSAMGTGCGKIYVNGGDIENGITGWMICTNSVRWKQYQQFLKTVNTANASLTDILGRCNKYEDYPVGSYVASPFETSGSVSNVYMEFSNTCGDNVFRNQGRCVLPGAIKGVTQRSGTTSSGLVLNGGTFYRLDYLYTNLSSLTDQFSFEKTKAVLTASARSVTEDPSIQQYLAYTGLTYSNSLSVGDDKADTKAKQANIFALCVGTGSQGTDKISGIVVNYVDNSGANRKETIAPTSLAQTYDLVKKWEYCGESENVKGDSRLMNYTDKPLSEGQAPTKMEPLTTVTYLFQTVTPLSYVTSIVIVGSDTSSWTCTELNVYRVSYLYPLEEYGYYSKDWYVPFKGSLIAETALTTDSTGVRSETFAWDNEQVSIGTDYYQLNVYDTPDKVESKATANGFTYYNVVKESKAYSTVMEDYTISVSLADVTNAGIEALYNVGTGTSLYSILNDVSGFNKIKEDVQLNLKLSYLDTHGSVRTATLPLIPSAMVWAYWNLDETGKNAPLHGLFQQGEKLTFVGALPDYQRGLEANVSYTDKDSIGGVAITSITISQPPYTRVYVDEGVLKVDYVDSALDFYAATTTGGTVVDTGSDMTATLKRWNGTEKLSPKSTGSKYLVVIETDSMAGASTTKDIQCSLSYKSVSGAVSSTGAFSLENAVNDYYGYWLDAGGAAGSIAYTVMSSPGNFMSCIIELSNLYEFESATFTIEGGITTDTSVNSDDDWQLKSIKIYELDALGERKVLLGQGNTVGAVSTDRTYYRSTVYGSRGCINSAVGPMMVKPGESKTISFETGDVGGGSISGEVVSKNKATNLESLSYEDAVQDFGFNTRRAMYTISVKVAGTAINSVEDGDCGSKNQFYFQLVFEDDKGQTRTSPCVLANQQLKSDGFRTAQIETFNIYTNDDYGTPIRVNVIPDDTSSNSDVFDKLNIEYISVSRTSNTGVDLNWQTEKDAVGWIDIEYREDAEEQNGRSNDELIRSFVLHKKGYNVKLEFGITLDSSYVNGKQFVGKVLADITYLDSAGTKKTLPNVDVVSAMAQYANRITEITTTASNANATSVADYMFVADHTNRFHVTFDDISSLVSIRLKITQESGNMKVKSIFARQVFGDGILAYNRFSEYERQYSQTPRDLTTSNNAKSVTVKTGVASTFNFTAGNSVMVFNNDEGSGVSVQKSTSEGQGDQLSMTVELDDTTDLTAGALLPVNVIYKNIYGDAYQVSRNLVLDAGSGRFMIPENNLPITADIAMPYQIEVGSGFGGRQLVCAKLNILRKGEVLDTFTFAPGTTTLLDNESSVTITLSESDMDAYARSKGYSSEVETLYLQLGEQTQKMMLSAAKDIQLALVYTEKDSPYDYEYTSDYINVSDYSYSVVESGTILILPMSVPNVGTVKGVRIRTTADGMSVNAARGCISMEENSNLTGSTLTTGWVNLPIASAKATRDGVLMSSDGMSLTDAYGSANNVVPVKISAQFAEIARNDAYFRMTIRYLDSANTCKTVVVDRLASEWNYSSPWILVNGLKTVLYAALEAHDIDGNNIAKLTLNSLELGWYTSTGVFTTVSYSGDKTITESAPQPFLVTDTALSGIVSGMDGTVVGKLEDNLMSADRTSYATQTLPGGCTISLSASLPGLYGQLEAEVVNTATNEAISGVSASTAADSLNISYVLPINMSAETIRYSVTVRIKDFPELSGAKVYVDVEPNVVADFLVFERDLFGTETLRYQYSLIRGMTFMAPVTLSASAGKSFVIYYRTNSTEELSFTDSSTEYPGYISVTDGYGSVSGYEGNWYSKTVTMLSVNNRVPAYIYLSSDGFANSPRFDFAIVPVA